MSVRTNAKVAVEQLLVRSGAEAISRWHHRRDVVIVAYHNIVPTGARTVGDASLHLSQEAFARQLDALKITHDVLALPVALRGAGLGQSRPVAVITFDDAYAGAVRVGVDELVRRDLPATIFVPPALLDGRAFWWDVLTPAGALAPPARVRDAALAELRGEGESILAREDPQGTLSAALPEHARGASTQDLIAAAGKPGVHLASHSWSHPNLARLDPATLAQELSRPLQWLRARFTNVLPYLSYPYGLFSSDVEEAARAAGYEAALAISGGLLRRRSATSFSLPRVNVPAGVSLEGFRLRTAGLV